MVASVVFVDEGEKMLAVHVPGSGQAAILGEISPPSASAGEVVIRVRAAGLNPFDNHIAPGALEQLIPHLFPLVLGRDVAGVVEAVGDDVTDVSVGDEVLGHVPFAAPFEAGTLADFAALPADQVTVKPEGLSFVDAAALPLAAGAARILVDAIDARPGQVVLVNGASGSVGRFAVQLLARQGVTVVATASPASTDRMRELGATEVVDYTHGSTSAQVLALFPEGVDALINLHGWTLEEVPVEAVRLGGIARTVTQIPDDATLAARGLTGGQVMASPGKQILNSLAEQAASGAVQVDIARTVPLSGALEALGDIEAGRLHGKVVVDLTL
ncbi:NADP-dependent oxidoreductase [Glaciibacter superstes]|uniref:NADP-dependent oxidoreductase n=1 Tax=Glaciibacter superstes TaxID=501023 RepID=UPI0003B7A6AA|nr:NADP-dependent oxidoreductase [Glaciibacter superstes]